MRKDIKRIWIWSGLLILFLFICFFYYKINPVNSDITIQCSFKKVTGWYCPGCGGQRAIHYLLHGELLFALQSNFLIFLFPFFLYLIYILIEVYLFKEDKYLSGFMFSGKLGFIALILLLFYTIARNIPYLPFVYLIPPE